MIKGANSEASPYMECSPEKILRRLEILELYVTIRLSVTPCIPIPIPNNNEDIKTIPSPQLLPGAMPIKSAATLKQHSPKRLGFKSNYLPSQQVRLIDQRECLAFQAKENK